MKKWKRNLQLNGRVAMLPQIRSRRRSLLAGQRSGWFDLNMSDLGNLSQQFRYYKISCRDGIKYNFYPLEIEKTIKKATGNSR